MGNKCSYLKKIFQLYRPIYQCQLKQFFLFNENIFIQCDETKCILQR